MASSARIDELRKKFDENPRRYFAPLANEYRKAGDPEQAIFICQEYLPQQPGHMSGHIVYGQALFDLGRLDEAKAVFETALSLDPENLIALRHLGDIARQTGDSRSARGWYQRVLEADPRNEEIAQLMLTLLGTPDSSHAPVPQRVTPALPDASQTYQLPAAAPSIAELATPDDRLQVEKTESESGLAAAVQADIKGEPERPVVPPPPAYGRAAPVAPPEDLMDLEELSVGGVRLNTLGSTPAIEPSPGEPFPLDPFAEPTASEDYVEEERESFTETSSAFLAPSLSEEEPDLEPQAIASAEESSLYGADEPFEADPFAIASKPEALREIDEPREELATDLALGLLDDGTAPSLSDPRDESTSQLMGLETFEDGFIGAGPTEPAGLALDSYFETTPEAPPTENVPRSDDASVPVSEAAPEQRVEPSFVDEPLVEPPVVAETTPAEVPVVDVGQEVLADGGVGFVEPEPAEAFVTETMAELYLQQGHIESARDIYQRLVEQHPGEHQLRDRLRAIEGRLAVPSAQSSAGQEAAAEPVADPVAEPAPPTPAGPTIREYLMGVLKRTTAGAPEPIRADESPAAAKPVVDHSPQPVEDRTTRTSAPPRETTVRGSIDALFSGVAAPADTSAASALAQAFAPERPEDRTLEGMPAHRAASELSLDHVFKSTQAPRPERESGGFSFDQFFADELAEPSAKPGTEPPAAAGDATDDLAQFNSWLNGLKKT